VIAVDNLEPKDAAFLVALGEKVRQVRAIRGLSRKVLAERANISERYIAKLESGLGNVSIILLRRVAEVTNTRLEDLLMDSAAHPQDWPLMRELFLEASPEKLQEVRALLKVTHELPLKSKKYISLIGLRGAGKTSLGKALAQKLNVDFIELNNEIIKEANLPLNEIHSFYGQEGYRRFEQTTLKRLIQGERPMVLATGGGIVSEPMTYQLLLSHFYTIWLQASPAEHMMRVRAQGDLRPMGSDKAAMNELVTILRSREPLYQKAHAVHNTQGESFTQSLAALTNIFKDIA
jgi:XRE family transcriptional regulator, aerobic/anaerobic benzoate catabolism transcriptional regulator